MPPTGVNPLVDPRFSFLIAAAAGVFLAWGFTELFGIGSAQFFVSKSASDRAAAIWIACFSLLFGGAVLSFDRVVAGAWEAAGRRAATAAIPLFGIGYVAGYAANALYLQIAPSGLFASPNDAKGYLARGIGWAIFGVGVGATMGLVDRSRSRSINGALGGAVGGGVGGLLFQAAGANLHTSDSLSRLIGLACVGGLIAVATRVVETARREAWLHVIAGGMAGKEFILYHIVTRIGASPECELFLLKDPAVAKVHAVIEDRGGRRTLTAAAGATVFVNGAPITAHALRDRDQIQIGHSVLAYAERAAAAVPTTGVFPGVR